MVFLTWATDDVPWAAGLELRDRGAQGAAVPQPLRKGLHDGHRARRGPPGQDGAQWTGRLPPGVHPVGDDEDKTTARGIQELKRVTSA